MSTFLLKTIYIPTNNSFINSSHILDRPNACDFTLKFKKKSFDNAYVKQTITSLASVFGINENK